MTIRTRSPLQRDRYFAASRAQLVNAAQVQAASTAKKTAKEIDEVDSALIDLGGDYVDVPGALTDKLAELEARIANLETI